MGDEVVAKSTRRRIDQAWAEYMTTWDLTELSIEADALGCSLVAYGAPSKGTAMACKRHLDEQQGALWGGGLHRALAGMLGEPPEVAEPPLPPVA